MSIDPFIFVASILGAVVATLIGKTLWDGHTRRKEFLDLQDRVEHFEGLAATRQTRITELENDNADLRRQEAERIAEDKRKKEHGRDQQQVTILTILGTQGSKSVKQIAEQVGISEELAITHLVDLCRDNCVWSPHYMPDSESWDYYPCHSVWHIRQAGRVYLAQNGLL